MAKIFVTRSILDNGIKILKNAGHEVVISKKNRNLTKKELIKELELMLLKLTDSIDILSVAIPLNLCKLCCW